LKISGLKFSVFRDPELRYFPVFSVFRDPDPRPNSVCMFPCSKGHSIRAYLDTI
jgi:hypothetical protein